MPAQKCAEQRIKYYKKKSISAKNSKTKEWTMQSARKFLTSRMPHATNTKNASGNQSAASHCLAGRENGRASQNGARPKKQFVPQVQRQNPTYGKEIQVDQAIVKLQGKIFKHFQACDRCSKFVYADVSAMPKA